MQAVVPWRWPRGRQDRAVSQTAAAAGSDKLSSSPSFVDEDGEIIVKVINKAGLCSRREAQALIEEGRVTLNGKKVKNPMKIVKPHFDFRIDGQLVPVQWGKLK